MPQRKQGGHNLKERDFCPLSSPVRLEGRRAIPPAIRQKIAAFPGEDRCPVCCGSGMKELATAGGTYPILPCIE
jgi:hypothetical protein